MRIFIFQLLLCACAWLSIHSVAASVSSLDRSMRQAEVYFEAGNYTQARSQYELLEGDYLAPWQQAIIAYDIATTWLAQDKWEEALAAFQNISLKNGELPLLQQRLTINMALARLRLAEQSLQKLANNSKVDEADYKASLMLLRQVLVDIEQARQASCKLYEAEGRSTCKASVEIEQMHAKTKNLLATLLQNTQVFRMHHMALQNGLTLLIAEEEVILQQQSFLQSKALTKEMGKKYLTAFQQEASSWLPLWKTLKMEMPKISIDEDSQASVRLLQQAQVNFEQGLDFMQAADFSKSQGTIEKSLAALNELLQLVFNHSSFKDILQRLIGDYNALLGQDPLQEIPFSALLKVQNGAEGQIEKSNEEGVKTNYLEARHYLEIGNELFRAFKPIQARMYVEMARSYIGRALELLNSISNKAVRTHLEEIIAQQELARRLTDLFIQVKGHEQMRENLDELLQSAQRETIAMTQDFLPAVKKEQQAGFAPQAKGKVIAWDEVIPLFIAGQQAAQRANESLQDKLKIDAALSLQDEAIKKWKAALNLLNKETASEQPEAEASQASSSQHQTQLEEKANPEENSSHDKVLKLIHEMEEDDRSKLELQTVPSNKREDRPW